MCGYVQLRLASPAIKYINVIEELGQMKIAE